ncbi:hypothetical protein HaLaN_20284 [Haematococcus lacustris]|uniref:Uncharacterized protein n=1 Tax=Haematococcus lacustris TaxID=44745 RepID=A0A6A0A1D3_HAELA|nr:hypothetical protein HaLaN_20284 [Haematococcus lacustris]
MIREMMQVERAAVAAMGDGDALDRASSCEEDSRHQPNSQHAHRSAPRKLSRGDSNSSSGESSGSSIDSSSSSTSATHAASWTQKAAAQPVYAAATLAMTPCTQDAGTEAAAATSAASCEDYQGGDAGGGMSRLQALALAPWAPPLMWDPLDRAWAWDPEQPV